MYPDAITDRKGHFVVTTALDPICEAFVVRRNGIAVGLYFDDSMPRIQYYIDLALQHCQYAKYKFVSVPMGRVGFHWKGMINLLEWYPYNAGWNPGRMPKGYAGYILQKRYPGYLIESHPNAKIKPPTLLQFNKILAQALLKRPEYIFYF